MVISTTTTGGCLDQSSARLASLDVLKGFAMSWIFYAHLGEYWNDGTWISAWRILYLLMDWVGPSLFIVASVLGTLLSIKKHHAGGKTSRLGIDAFKKFSYMFLIGTALNIVIEIRNTDKLGAWALLGMNMITAIAFVQLFVIALYKMRPWQRLALLVALLATHGPLLAWCLDGMGHPGSGEITSSGTTVATLPGLLYYLLFDFTVMISTYTWLQLSIASYLVFDSFTTFIVSGPGKGVEASPARRARAVRLLATGVGLLLVAVLAGGWIVVPGLGYSHGTYVGLTSDDPFSFWSLPGMPLVFFRHVPHYAMYNLGVFTCALAVLYWFVDIKESPSRFMATFGMYSFSTFVYGHAFWLVPFRLPFWLFWVVLATVLIGLWYGVLAWDRKAGGVLSLEWGMKRYLAFLTWAGKRRKA